jgi:hypothetical protein
MIANLMVFYKGGLSYTELQNMPLPEVYKLNKFAERINKERERAMKNGV